MKSTRLTGICTRIFRLLLSNYLGLTAEMALSREEIGELVSVSGLLGETGFDRDDYRRVFEQAFK